LRKKIAHKRKIIGKGYMSNMRERSPARLILHRLRGKEQQDKPLDKHQKGAAAAAPF